MDSSSPQASNQGLTELDWFFVLLSVLFVYLYAWHIAILILCAFVLVSATSVKNNTEEKKANPGPDTLVNTFTSEACKKASNPAASTEDHSNVVTISDSSISHSWAEELRGKTIGEVLLIKGGLEQLEEISAMSNASLVTLKHQLQSKNNVALVIGSFPLLHRQVNGKYEPYARSFRLGLHIYVDLFNLATLLNGQWLSSFAIDGILAELAVLSPGVQLMSSENTFLHYCKLKQNKLVPWCDTMQLHSDTSTLVFPFNLSNEHWCVAKATYHDGERFLTVYNSKPGQDANMIETWLPAVLDCVVNNSSVFSWSNSQWAPQKVQYGQSLRQSDGFNCGIYTILNTLALVQHQEPSLQPVNANALRLEYAQALIRAA